MKLIIDIPDDTHERITRPDRLFTDDDINKVCWAVYNGTPIPDNATNEEAARVLFPFTIFVEDRSTNRIVISKEWWNAPYQKGGKDER